MWKRVRTTVAATAAIIAAASILSIAATSSASAGRPCKSQAGPTERATAEAFCEGKLKCSEKTPPQEINCTYKANRWICRCVKPKGSPNGKYNLLLRMELGVKVEMMSLPVDD